MIRQITVVVLSASLLNPVPAAAQTLRVVMDAHAPSPAIRVMPLALSPIGLTPTHLSLTSFAATIGALAPAPVPALVPLAEAKPETPLADIFDGSSLKKNAQDATPVVPAAPTLRYRSFLGRSASYGATALAVAVPDINNGSAIFNYAIPDYIKFPIIIAASIGLMVLVHWMSRHGIGQWGKWKPSHILKVAGGWLHKVGAWSPGRNASPEESKPIGVPVKKSARRTTDAGDIIITFDDVAGQEEALNELKKVVAFIKSPERYRKLGVKRLRNVLLFGPPGTGKTLIARAVAGEAGANFHEVDGSSFVNTYVGKGPDNIREAFNKARGDGKTSGILFIDEIDAVGKKRGAGNEGNQEYENTLNALLNEMSIPKNKTVTVIAATNRPELLDPALMRGGRLGLKVPVGRPDVAGREAILKLHMQDMALAADVSPRLLAELTPGLSGADLEEIVNDAAMIAGERPDAAEVTVSDFRKAVDRQTIGHERRLVMSAFEKQVVANHESGHALVAKLVPNGDQIRKITIIPHGLEALGLVQTMDAVERHMYSKSWLEDRIAITLGGRVAEQLTTGEAYSGAANDFETATLIARRMVMKFGMSKIIGPVSYDMEGERPAAGRALSQRQMELIDDEVSRIIQEQQARVVKLIGDYRAHLDATAAELMTQETLREDDVERLLPARLKPTKKGETP
ncbi:MAG: AAA family ATPase [Elusimicrobiota bacterium]